MMGEWERFTDQRTGKEWEVDVHPAAGGGMATSGSVADVAPYMISFRVKGTGNFRKDERRQKYSTRHPEETPLDKLSYEDKLRLLDKALKEAREAGIDAP